MFSKKVAVIAFSKSEVIAAKVDVREKRIVGKAYSSKWRKGNIVEIFAEVTRRVKSKKYRVVLGDNLIYSFVFDKKNDTDTPISRKKVYEKVLTRLPDEFEIDEWDFVEVTKADKKKVVVFAPVKYLLAEIREAVNKFGLVIEAIEPATVAQTRNKNPVVGIALKEDLSGADENVLNIKLSSRKKLSKKIPETKDKQEDSGLPKRNTKNIILSTISILLILASLVFLILFLVNKKEKDNTQGVNNILDKSNQADVLVEEKSEYEYRVAIAKFDEDDTEKIYEILLAEEFAEIEITSQSDEDREADSLEVVMRAETPESVFDVIERALNSEYEIIRSEEALQTDLFDAVIEPE